MDLLKKFGSSHKLLILTGTGVTLAAILSYSICKYQKCQKEDSETCQSPVHVREANSWLKDDIEILSPEVAGPNKGSPHEESTGWLTPTPSNGNLVCREVQNAEEIFERDSPKGPTESDYVVEDIEVDAKVLLLILFLDLKHYFLYFK